MKRNCAWRSLQNFPLYFRGVFTYMRMGMSKTLSSILALSVHID